MSDPVPSLMVFGTAVWLQNLGGNVRNVSADDQFPSRVCDDYAACGVGPRIIHDVPKLSLSIAKRDAKNVVCIGMKTWPPFESSA